VQEGDDHRLLVGAVAERTRRRLQRVLAAVDVIAEFVPCSFERRALSGSSPDFELALEELVLSEVP
jgi:hypothetical protein